MQFVEKWKNVLSNAIPNDVVYVERSKDEKWIQERVRCYLIANNKLLAVDSVLNDNILEAKRRFSYAAMSAEYCFYTYNHTWPYWDIKPYSFALLSDNKALIERLLVLPVESHLTAKERSEKPAFFNYAFRGLLTNDRSNIARALDQLNSEIKSGSEIEWKKAYISCIESLTGGVKSEVEDAIRLLEDSSIKSQALKADLCEEVLSFFTLYFAKIAWITGIHVNLESKYVPLALLEIKPLQEYSIPYWYLREFYQEQGEEWKYDPLYPEIQKDM